MQKSDRLLRGTLAGEKITIALVDLTSATKEAVSRHQADPLSALAIGRTLVCTSLLGASLKQVGESIRCIFTGNGPIKQVVGEFIAPRSVRGYSACPQIVEKTGIDSIPSSLSEALGKGELVITRKIKGEKEPYQSVTALVSGEVAMDVAHYLRYSEQIPSAISAGVKLSKAGLVEAACGVLIQRLGESCSTETVDQLEDFFLRLDMSTRMSEGVQLETFFNDINSEVGQGRILEELPLRFECFCSRESFLKTLQQLGKSELEKSLDQNGNLIAKCHFCNTNYTYQREDLLVFSQP